MPDDKSKHFRRSNLRTRLTGTLTTILWSVLLAFALVPCARGQESIADAARNARTRKTSTVDHARIITNADLAALNPGAPPSVFPLQTNAAENSSPVDASAAVPSTCDNPQAEGLRAELQAAQQELDQLRRDLQYSSPVVSGNNLDPQYFRPGNSGFNVGAPPLLDSQPPAPARVTEVELQERIGSLNKALRIACAPPEGAKVQADIDQAEDELNLLQRQFALDQEDYYSTPVTERLGSNSQLEAEQQQIQDLQAQVDALKAELAALLPPQS